MKILNKKLFLILSFILLTSAAIQPAAEKSDWVLEPGLEGAFENAAAPVMVRPLALKPLPKVYEPLEAMPPRMPFEVERNKGAILQKGTVPSFIPQAFLQTDTSAKSQIQLLAPSRIKAFKGLSQTRFFPADPTIAAGPKHIVVATNSAVGIFTKRGKKLADIGFGQWFENVDEIKGSSLFDPKILYDQYAGHFILLVDAVRDKDKGAWFLLSVSETSDATGNWFSWALDMTRNGTRKVNAWTDFPGLGVDQNAIYMTGNLFSFATDNFLYAKLRIVKKSEVYAFGRIGFFDRWSLKDATGHKADTVQPAHSFGASTVEYLVSCDGGRGTKITLWYVPNPTASRPSLKKKGVAVSSYLVPPDAKQKGLAVEINTGSAGFRNAAFFNGFIYTAQSISHNWGSGEVSSIRFYQIAESGVVQQEITYGADKTFYYYPAVTVDSRGHVVIVFNRSAASEYVGVYFTGRKANDALGKLQSSKSLKISDDAYFAQDSVGRNRWGDYSGIALDEGDSVWIYGEFAVNHSTWSTEVGRVKYR